MIRRFDAWVLRRLLTGAALDGEPEAVSEPWRPIADHLAALPVDDRLDAWKASLADRDDRDQVILALATVDPQGPPPPIQDHEAELPQSQPAQGYPALAVGQRVKAT